MRQGETAHAVSRSVFRALTISGQPGGQVRSSDYPAGFSEGLRRCDGADPEGNVTQLPEPLAGAARGPDRVSASPGPLPRGACRKRLNRITSANRAAVGWRRVYCELAGGQYGGARRAGRVLVAARLSIRHGRRPMTGRVLLAWRGTAALHRPRQRDVSSRRWRPGRRGPVPDGAHAAAPAAGRPPPHRHASCSERRVLRAGRARCSVTDRRRPRSWRSGREGFVLVPRGHRPHLRHRRGGARPGCW